jgi:hypothetical protein
VPLNRPQHLLALPLVLDPLPLSAPTSLHPLILSHQCPKSACRLQFVLQARTCYPANYIMFDFVSPFDAQALSSAAPVRKPARPSPHQQGPSESFEDTWMSVIDHKRKSVDNLLEQIAIPKHLFRRFNRSLLISIVSMTRHPSLNSSNLKQTDDGPTTHRRRLEVTRFAIRHSGPIIYMLQLRSHRCKKN